MKVAAITGFSGSGKTTLLVELVAHLVARGERVAAIKHTHHEVSEEDRGDTARLRAAGADPVLLAGDDEAVVFSTGAPRRISFVSPDELLSGIDADLVLVEGFKDHGGWPRIELSEAERRTPDDVLSILDKIWTS